MLLDRRAVFQSAVLGGNQVVGHQGTSLSGREAKNGERAPDGYFWEGVSKGYASFVEYVTYTYRYIIVYAYMIIRTMSKICGFDMKFVSNQIFITK